MVIGLKNYNIEILEFLTGRFLRTLSGHTQCITALAISSDSKTLVSGGRDNHIKIWDLKEGIEI